jgi:Leucine carboxyl methyltransferase
VDEERPSVTAEGAAVMRALHQTLDDEPKILDDPISPRLVDTHSDFYQSRLKLLELLPAPTRLRLKATFVMRSRFAEDRLAEAATNGLRQYVVLSPGLILSPLDSRHGATRFVFMRLTIPQLSNGSAGAWLKRASPYRRMCASFPSISRKPR